MAATPAPLAATFEDRRWRCLDVLLTREGHLCGADFEPAAEVCPRRGDVLGPARLLARRKR
eukprot:scaffold3_cov389-Prasinococcus_capsulatus_cf.AAC.23